MNEYINSYKEKLFICEGTTYIYEVSRWGRLKRLNPKRPELPKFGRRAAANLLYLNWGRNTFVDFASNSHLLTFNGRPVFRRRFFFFLPIFYIRLGNHKYKSKYRQRRPSKFRLKNP